MNTEEMDIEVRRLDWRIVVDEEDGSPCRTIVAHGGFGVRYEVYDEPREDGGVIWVGFIDDPGAGQFEIIGDDLDDCVNRVEAFDAWLTAKIAAALSPARVVCDGVEVKPAEARGL